MDARRRNLSVLAAAATVSVLLAALALYEQSATFAPKADVHKMFPDLDVHKSQIVRFHFASKKGGTFDVVFRPNRGTDLPWVIPQKSDYPASGSTVDNMRDILAGMTTIEPKTASPELYHAIGVDDPKDGDGLDVSAVDDHGHEIVHLIVGRTQNIGDENGAVGLFVRKPGEAQSWLVRASSEIPSTPENWLDKKVIDIEQSRIQSTTIAHPDGTSYEVRRQAKADLHFTLSSMPAGRELANPNAPDGPALALVGFAFEDVKPAKDVDFNNSIRLTSRTFDGLVVTADVAKVGAQYWVQLDAANQSNTPSVAKEARAIDARTAGWAYKLADYKGAQFTTPLESLFKPKGGGQPSPMPLDQGDQNP
jgi:hypothetical protein